MATLDELTATAAAVLGPERAGQLQSRLEERAAQIDRVLAHEQGSTSHVAASGLPGPTVASVAAARDAAVRAREHDRRVRAWAWRADQLPATSRSAEAGATLDGYAIGIKDVIDVARAPTRAGSPLTSPVPVETDAPVVARIRAGGAVIVGKTACTEWALNDPAPTRNPWDATRTPGGSSAGSGAAVATGMCTATVDTQTAGDVVRPAAYTGVVGFKPSAGWAPIDGTRQVAPTIDTIGVIARSVDQAATVVTTIRGSTRLSISGAPATPRLAIVRDGFLDASAAISAQLDATIAAWREAGAVVDEIASSVDLRAIHGAHRIIAFAECAAVHAERLRPGMPGYGPRARDLLELGLVTPAYTYARAQALRSEATEAVGGMFRGIDAAVLPVVPGPPPPADTTGDSRFQIPWTLLGLPAISLPTGVVDGLPTAVQLVGAPGGDDRLLAAAKWCEDALGLGLDLGLPLRP